MIANLDYNSKTCFEEIQRLVCCPSQAIVLNTNLYASCYFQRLSQMTQSYKSSELEEFQRKSQAMKKEGFEKEAMLYLTKTEQDKLYKEIEKLSYQFQRSSSAIEGRNSHLSLQVHRRRRECARSKEVQRVLHNFFVTRVDGTTAAERFFEKPHDKLFEYLLIAVPDYPTPAMKRGSKFTLKRENQEHADKAS